MKSGLEIPAHIENIPWMANDIFTSNIAARASVAKLSCITHHLFQAPAFRKLCSSLGGGENWVWTRASFVPELKQYHLYQTTTGSIQKSLYLNCDWGCQYRSQHYVVLNSPWLVQNDPCHRNSRTITQSSSPLPLQSSDISEDVTNGLFSLPFKIPSFAAAARSMSGMLCLGLSLAGMGSLLQHIYCLGGMCNTGPGSFWQQEGQHSTSF